MINIDHDWFLVSYRGHQKNPVHHPNFRLEWSYFRSFWYRIPKNVVDPPWDLHSLPMEPGSRKALQGIEAWAESWFQAMGEPTKWGCFNQGYWPLTKWIQVVWYGLIWLIWYDPVILSLLEHAKIILLEVKCVLMAGVIRSRFLETRWNQRSPSHAFKEIHRNHHFAATLLIGFDGWQQKIDTKVLSETVRWNWPLFAA